MADPIVIYKLDIPGNRFPSYRVAQRSTWGHAAAARSACEDKSTKNDTCHMLVKVDATCVSLWLADTREPDGSSTQGIGYGENHETVKRASPGVVAKSQALATKWVRFAVHSQNRGRQKRTAGWLGVTGLRRGHGDMIHIA